ncbi:PXA domain-containing protein [Phthorimaea operculella]|nr:PXA domain-containing protein [Phthorimaea operculella]
MDSGDVTLVAGTVGVLVVVGGVENVPWAKGRAGTNVSCTSAYAGTAETAREKQLAVIAAAAAAGGESFKFIQWLLHLNKPLKYDLDALAKNYPNLECILGILPRVPKKAANECKEYDTNELSVISTVLERRLVSSWYTHYVSQEIGFPFACKQMLDQMIGKTFQICSKVETKDIYVDICTVLITHLKEYKKAIKRHEKTPQEPIETLYKKSHQIYSVDKKSQTAEHCTNLLRIILKELVPWELWDTPHSELLVRILSKRLDNFIDTTLADPVWLNDKLMTILKGKVATVVEKKEEEPVLIDEDKPPVTPLLQETLEEPKEIELTKAEDVPKPETSIESALSTLVAKTTAPILQNALNEDFGPTEEVDNVDTTAQEAINGTQAVDITESPVLRQRRGRQGRSEVKIYDRIVEGTIKTWETDTDLQCISLGQDLLASLNGEITLSRLWGQDPQDYDGKQESRFWFGDEDVLDMETDSKDSKEVSPVKKEHSPKPTADALIKDCVKDIQTTVHQAKTKIGDLQVPHVIDVPNNDEAAGMMEGLLDFGIAGLKKGLRFTGLSDDDKDKSPSYREKSEKSPPFGSKDKEKSEKSPPFGSKDRDRIEKSPPPDTKHKQFEMKDTKPTQQKDTTFSTIIQREDNGTTVPPLVKQQRVSSQDSVLASMPKPILSSKGEFPLPLVPLSDSPEPEYEEAADLSTSIAKLRCLLQQRAESGHSSQSAKSEDIWWESAEETRGRTQQHHSSRPVDTAAFADEYDMNAIEKSSPNQTSNNMQRLDRLFQRTVTGVFNSIKTAVGAEGETEGVHRTLHDWTYVCTSIEASVGGAVARLVGSRRAYNHVDAALDSLEQLTAAPPKKEVVPEDFEEWCAVLGVGWCAGAELAAAAGLCEAHLTYRIATLLFADLSESFINVYLDELTSWLRRQIFTVFEQMADQEDGRKEKDILRKFDIEETCDAIVEKLPALQVFGAETVNKSVHLCVSSLSHKEINKDVMFRALDLYALHFKKAAGLRNPSFDAN